MDRVRAIADAHYRAGPPELKILAYDFFRALDTDGDGLVSLQEFLGLMVQEGHTRLANPHFFRELDRDKNGFLDFWEVLTLYYIIKSEMPVCACCEYLILDTYFSCVECFDCPRSSYSLCITCYGNNRSRHHHDGRQQFLDTFMLLKIKKGQQTDQATSDVDEEEQQPNWDRPNAIVPTYTGIEGWQTALMAFELALGIENMSATLCTIL